MTAAPDRQRSGRPSHRVLAGGHRRTPNSPVSARIPTVQVPVAARRAVKLTVAHRFPTRADGDVLALLGLAGHRQHGGVRAFRLAHVPHPRRPPGPGRRGAPGAV
ncbi:hypothetical protein GA0115245_10403 [Streptomyces sp. di188]|nr:hypothetical protein GA0115245_10403 [Streptomyces sp. di188]SCD46885.1 hypothetical protein GA0115238_11023 [Streptomyces sp. di50b]